MAKKIKLVTFLIIAVILACSASALITVNGQRIDNVENLKMTENTASTVSVKWSSVNKAAGYRIYVKSSENGEYELHSEIEDGDKTRYVLENFEPASVYDIEVTAFKYFRKQLYESEEAVQLKVCTLPDKLNESLTSKKEGLLTLEWEPSARVDGYEVEYADNEEFKKSNTEIVKGGKNGKFELSGLTPNDVYYAKVRAYFDFDGETVYGEWSDISGVKIMEKVVMTFKIDPKKPVVALSFDDGPGYADGKNANPTKRILDVLDEYGARATFFMCGSRIAGENEECLKRELELGCEIGNHTYDHKHYGKNVTAADISKCSNLIEKKCGKAPTIFRCPGGSITSEIRKECKKEGMPIAYWSIDTEDWKSKDPDKIYKAVMNNVYDGAIILMHDIYPTTADAVEKIVPELVAQGYQVVGVSEMITAKNNGKAPQAGQQYVNYKTINNNTR